ncbi:sugar kinase [Streptococcus merionis]|uniref:sugar kinase n=1 Tax=Streptococcus merionis TaxID=400065 RepID=UPI0026EEC9CF|nr:sugar kinase [Streptococcus merionis]
MPKVLCFGEALIRMTPKDFTPIQDHAPAGMFFGGAEINVARTLAGLGASSKVLSVLPDNPIGERFLAFLFQSQIDTSAIYRSKERLGLYFLEEGFGIRQSQVFYDRSHTGFLQFPFETIDIENLLEDVDFFFFSGITVSLGKAIQNFLETLLQALQEKNIPICFDLNYRSSLLSVREAKRVFSHFAQYADYCIGIEPLMLDEDDLQLFDRDKASLSDLETRLQGLKERYHLKAIFHTQRTLDVSNLNTYQAFGYSDQFVSSCQLQTPILQRVGSGDAFAAGLIFKLLENSSLQDSLNFAVAAATLKCTYEGDSLFVKKEAVTSLLNSPKDIRR